MVGDPASTGAAELTAAFFTRVDFEVMAAVNVGFWLSEGICIF